jgi:S1-C subfamily serine protease
MQTWPLVAAVASALALVAGTSDAQTVRAAFQKANPSVVLIRTTARAAVPGNAGDKAAQADGVGSGVLVSADGKVVTAAHVVKSDATIEVSFLDGVPIQASVIWMAPSADLALLQLARVPPGAVVATFGNSDLLETGDQVLTIGAPYGANHSLAVGWISARRQPSPVYEDATPLELLQADLSVFGGNSGGPLLNLDGEVVGVVTHLLSGDGTAGGPSFSVAGNVVKRLLLDERRTWFGVESFMLAGPLAEAFNLPQSAGLLVQSVSPSSLAARLGLRGGSVQATITEVPLFLGGDVLLEILGVPVMASPTFMSTFLMALDKVKAGDTVTARVWRNGRVVPLEAIVTAP